MLGVIAATPKGIFLVYPGCEIDIRGIVRGHCVDSAVVVDGLWSWLCDADCRILTFLSDGDTHEYTVVDLPDAPS